jgi:LmbE family N-acetylglucosaminyl deacetylase
MANQILIVAAHPDDEALGCGGAIARHVAAGDSIAALFLADGETSRGTGGGLSSRREAARKAAKILGFEAQHFLDFPDNRLDSVPLLDVVRAVEAVLAAIRPNMIYTHHAGDLNVDHRIAQQAVLTACRPLAGSSVERILAFEVPSSTEWSAPGVGPLFAPNVFVDIAEFLPKKLAALAAYADEMRPFPHPRSIEAVGALARWRGASAGMAAAEAFMLVRDLRR